ncbi:MAG: hypothetical protein M1839_005195 [Geoglossum umbratile]|nr:MAG: hypothetical protein M1839_005195 [Geoglossum umbratile]
MAKKATRTASAATRKSALAKKMDSAPPTDSTQDTPAQPTEDAADRQTTDTNEAQAKPNTEMADTPNLHSADPPIERPATAASDSSGPSSEFKVPTRKDEGLVINTQLPISGQSSLDSSPLSEAPSGTLSQVASASESELVGRERSSRKRRAPRRFTDEPESPASIKSVREQTAPRKRAKPTPRSNKATQKWSEKGLFEGVGSVLASVDLVKLFSDPRTWDLLDAEEKQTVAANFPAGALDGPLDNPATRFRQDFLRYNNDWKGGVRMFQEDIASGRYDPEWIRQARKSMADRAEGDFDMWKEREYEEFWGQKQKMAQNVIAGESNKIKLETLVRNDVFQVGDIWYFSRSFASSKGKKPGILVEKEAMITAIGDNAKLTFTYPPGRHKLSSPHLRPDAELSGVTGPSQLENAIIKADGRITSPPNGNAWKVIRCKRKNQDLGALWDMRQFYFTHRHKA